MRDHVVSVSADVDLVRPASQGGKTVVLRRAGTCAALLLLTALAAVAMTSGGAGHSELAGVGAWSRTVIGQATAGSSTPNQELSATDAAIAAAADAAGVVKSEAPAAASAPVPAISQPVEERASVEAGTAEAVAEPEQPTAANEEVEVPVEAAAAPLEPAQGFQPPPGFPFPSTESQQMIEQPLANFPGGNTQEFPRGVVYNGPPVGVFGNPSGGRMIVNMAGQPNAGTAMVERPEVSGIAPAIMRVINNAIASGNQPVAAAPAAAVPVVEQSTDGGEAAAPAAAGASEEDEPSEEEIQAQVDGAMGGEQQGAAVQAGAVLIPVPAVSTDGWTYTGVTGPASWGSLGYPTCSTGLQQSPVNVEQNVMKANLPTLAWQIPAAGTGKTPGAVFNGKSISLQGYDAVMSYDGRDYTLQEAVVHTPSEHTFGGQHYPMEIEFVHATSIQGEQKFLVMSAFVRTHFESNAVLAKLAAASTGLTPGAAVSLEGQAFEDLAMSVLGQMEAVNPTVTNAQNYYQYEGSMTAPPCQQGTTWLLLKNALAITFEDLAKFTNVQGSNNRPVQALGDRNVFDSHVAV